jgi:hypothetical protein
MPGEALSSVGDSADAAFKRPVSRVYVLFAVGLPHLAADFPVVELEVLCCKVSVGVPSAPSLVLIEFPMRLNRVCIEQYLGFFLQNASLSFNYFGRGVRYVFSIKHLCV